MKKRKVILLQVVAPIQSASGTSGMFVPLALGLLKAQAMQEGLCEKHYDIEIINSKMLNFGEKRLIEYIVEQKADIIGFSCYGWNYLRSQYLCKKIKEMLPNVFIFFGGPEVGPRSVEVLEETPTLHLVARGEGEITFIEILKCILENRGFKDVKGVTYRDNDNIIKVNEDRPVIEDLDSIASPYIYNTFELQFYEEMVIETLRGCPFTCGFCFYGGGQKKIRYFSMERVKKEFEIIKMLGGPRRCEFIDPNFNLPSRLEEIHKVIMEINREKYFRFRIEVNPEFVTEEQIQMFKDMNVKHIEVGIQSTNEEELMMVNRAMNKSKVSRSIALLKDCGIETNFHLIMGLPKQTINSFKNSYQYLIDQGVGDKVNSFLLQVLPGTDLSRRSEELGLKCTEYPPHIIQETPDLSPQDIKELIKIRSRFIVENRKKEIEFDEISNDYIEKEQPISNCERLRYNSFLNLSYENINHQVRKYTFDNIGLLKADINKKILSRIVLDSEVFNDKKLMTQCPNIFTNVFNQVYLKVNNKNEDLDNACKVLKKVFLDNPFACADFIFDGDSILSDEDVKKIYANLFDVLLPLNYLEIERTRKRIELVSIIPYTNEGIKSASKLSRQIMPVFKVTVGNYYEIESQIERLEEDRVNAVLFSIPHITDWEEIHKILDKIDKFNRKNNYVFFENIAIQQLYQKNYIFKDVECTKFTKHPFGYQDGEITLSIGSDGFTLYTAEQYPFE